MLKIAPTGTWTTTGGVARDGNQYVDSICDCGSCTGFMRILWNALLAAGGGP